MIVPLTGLAALVGLGVWEKQRHDKNLSKLDLRINVNGIRGKSTVTRLLTYMIQESGKNTLGKTTGTQASFLYPHVRNEEKIIRRPEGANINEQKKVVDKAAKMNSDVLVSECMAVNPDYQIVFEKYFLKSHITIITNVIEDHLDVMGPNLKHIARAFSETIPTNGYLVIPHSEFDDFFIQESAKRNTKVVFSEPETVDERYVSKFDYLVFKENVALALAVAKILEIDEKTAKKGMLNAIADPGALRIHSLKEQGIKGHFVNGFAINDPTSTLKAWNQIDSMKLSRKKTVVMNCREDRLDRTEQFIDKVFPNLEVDQLILVGKLTNVVTDAHKKRPFPIKNVESMEGMNPENVIEQLKIKTDGHIVYGVGNIHGDAHYVIDFYTKNESEETK